MDFSGPVMKHRFRLTYEQAREDMVECLHDYTRIYSISEVPAVGKIRSNERQMIILRRQTIACNCVGGLAMDDPDLQKLIRKGLMKFVRIPYGKGWGGNYALRRTYAVATPKGKLF